MSLRTDEELMASYQEGSEEAFKELYKRHSGKIYGYLKSKVKSEQQASDLYQEVFMKIHRSKHLYKKSLPVIPWIFSITYSVMIDGLRKTSKDNILDDYDMDTLPTPVTEPIFLPEELSNLPSNQQTALKMRYVDEKTFQEIADSLNTSPTHVRKLVSRGILQLKKILNNGDKS